ncbi:hypothetical protein EES41_39880 (plasmid) [Streptomyces sp. ADI95-16]|nr:hypothetical protein EES41_39880 [Streptomyces sp. ADI95-16]
MDDWDRHVADVAVPLPTELENLPKNVTAAIGSLAAQSPTAALRAARQTAAGRSSRRAAGRVISRSVWSGPG